MKNKILSFILIGIFIFSFVVVSADSIGTYKKDRPMQITNYCASADCTYANISSITSPSGIVSYLNLVMTKNGNNFNYSYTPTEIGTYTFKTCSNPSSTEYCESDTFEVTPNGFTTNVAFYLIWFVIGIGLIILGYSVQDHWILILGSFVLVLFGLYIIIFGLMGMKDTAYTWGIGLVVVMFSGYLGIRSGLEQIGE